MVAEKYGQDPRTVALWEPDWLAAALTVMEAENGAAVERAAADRRASARSKMRGA